MRPGSPPVDGGAAPEQPVTRFRDIVRSELIKFRSTRPGPLIVAGSLVAGAGTALLFANATAQRYPDFDRDEQRSFDPTNTSLRGRSLLEVTMGVLGALAVTSEYGAGTITPSLTAVPDRDRLLAAKALTTAGISLGIGVHTRSTAGAVSTIFGAEWLVPGIGPAFPKPLPDLLTKYWLTEAGASIFATRPDPKLLSPLAGLGVMAGSTTALLASAFLRSGSGTCSPPSRRPRCRVRRCRP